MCDIKEKNVEYEGKDSRENAISIVVVSWFDVGLKLDGHQRFIPAAIIGSVHNPL